MELTKEQFKAQFKHEINNGGLAFNLDMLVYDSQHFGYTIWRLLEKLVLQDGERYFISSIG